jgi:hypothetical protein
MGEEAIGRVSQKVDPEIARLVQERLRGDEMVEHWHQSADGTITENLISAADRQKCAQMAREFGFDAGSGRSLAFRKQNGEWQFIGAGGWIT